jgi:signal transduction histidine kinase
LEGRRFWSDIETAAYRIVQEALTNVARHAKVQHVEVRIWVTHNKFGIQIEDQGRGFDPQTRVVGNIGLIGMHERARLLGGTLTIEAKPGSGTHILAEWPLGDRGEGGGHERDHRPGR